MVHSDVAGGIGGVLPIFSRNSRSNSFTFTPNFTNAFNFTDFPEALGHPGFEEILRVIPLFTLKVQVKDCSEINQPLLKKCLV